MTSPTDELQEAIYGRLTGDAAVTALIGQRVYDNVPRGADGAVTAQFPYASFGPSDELSDDAECITGFDISMQIDVWSREPGYPEARQAADAVRQALHDHEFNLTGNALVYFKHRVTRFFRDPDGLTSHAALTFQAFAEQP